MRLLLKTKVNGHYQSVMARFDRQLFEALAPPVGQIEIVEFTGSQTGDRVHLRFLSPVKTDWISDIVAHGDDGQEAYFVDEGVKLPFPLAEWRHRHVVRRLSEDESCIIDDITYKGVNAFFTLLLYPALFLGFFPRKRIYRKYFGS